MAGGWDSNYGVYMAGPVTKAFLRVTNISSQVNFVLMSYLKGIEGSQGHGLSLKTIPPQCFTLNTCWNMPWGRDTTRTK